MNRKTKEWLGILIPVAVLVLMCTFYYVTQKRSRSFDLEETTAGLYMPSDIPVSEDVPEDVISAAEESMEKQYYVYVCGCVLKPGVYQLPEGSRIFDAVQLAGGYTQEALSSGVNLAQMIEDGMQIYIPSAKEDASQSGIYNGIQPGSGKVNINMASPEELMTLSGIGQSRAAAIIEYRETNGKFKKIEDIMNVPGIKEGAFQKIKSQITV